MDALKPLLLLLLGLIPLVCGLAPIKLVDCMAKVSVDSRRRRYASAAISVLSCFAAGVILGVSLIELLPEAREGLEEVAKTNPFFASYPFAELLVGVGLLLVYFIEELIALVFGIDHHPQASPSSKPSHLRQTVSTPVLDDASARENGHPVPAMNTMNTMYESMADRTRNLRPALGPSGGGPESSLESGTSVGGTSCSDYSELDLKGDDIVEEEKDRAVIGAATLVMAMLIHTSLEGFAFGIQTKSASINSLFFGIAVHKALVFFSVGLALTQALPHKRWVVVVCITLLASFTPLGGVLGILVERSNSPAKAITSSTLTAISIGTFLYIAIFEILVHERHKKLPKLLQWAGCALGYATMAATLLFAHDNHEE